MRGALAKLFGVLILLVAASALGKSPKVASPQNPPMERHLFASILYSGANQIQYNGMMDLFGSSTAFTATERTASAIGFSGGYIHRQTNSFGYSGDLSFELPRASSGITGSAGGLNIRGTYDQAPSNSLLTAAANGNFSIGSRVYIFAGINHPFVFSGEGGQSLTGQIGPQFGGGFAVTERISAELEYRQLRMKGSIQSPPLNLGIDQATFAGFILTIHMLF